MQNYAKKFQNNIQNYCKKLYKGVKYIGKLIIKEKNMGEKKEVKVRLSTVVYLFIILVLVVALGVVYYFGYAQALSHILEHFERFRYNKYGICCSSITLAKIKGSEVLVISSHQT